jgi:hypothetical protein
MSDTTNNQAPTESATTPVPVATGSESVPESVPYTKFRELLDETKKAKASFSETKAQLDKLLSEREEAEKKRLEETNNFKALYEKAEKDRNKLIEMYETEKRSKVNDRKYNAFIKEVGGLRKEEYRKFVDIDALPAESDGSIDTEKIRDYAMKFKEQFPELLAEPSKPQPPSTAPRATPSGEKPKSLEELKLAYVEARKVQPR